MKRITIACLFAIATFSTANAQKIFSLYLVGNMGIGSAKIEANRGEVHSKIGGGFGMHAKVRLLKPFDLVIQPTVNFRGYTSTEAGTDYDVNATYIDVPVDIEYHFTFADLRGGDDPDLFFIGAGVYGAQAIGGKYTNKETSETKNIKFGEATTDNRSLTDFGLHFIVGLNSTKFRIGFQDQIGKKNVVPKDRQTNNTNIRLNNFSFFVAYKL